MELDEDMEMDVDMDMDEEDMEMDEGVGKVEAAPIAAPQGAEVKAAEKKGEKIIIKYVCRVSRHSVTSG